MLAVDQIDVSQADRGINSPRSDDSEVPSEVSSEVSQLGAEGRCTEATALEPNASH